MGQFMSRHCKGNVQFLFSPTFIASQAKPVGIKGHSGAQSCPLIALFSQKYMYEASTDFKCSIPLRTWVLLSVSY